MTAAEFLAALEKDPDYQQRTRQRDLELAELAEKRSRKLELFTSDLQATGIERTADPVTGWASGDPRIFAVALEHLSRSGYDDETRARIAHHLQTKSEGAVAYWNQVLANLVEDESFGSSRLLFLRPINRLRRNGGKEFVARFLDDPLLGKEATAIMKGKSTRLN